MRIQSLLIAVLIAMLCASCGRQTDTDAAVVEEAVEDASGSVTISGDDRQAGSLTWTRPQVTLDEDGADQAREQAGEALEEGRLYDDGEAAIPLYLALLDRDADNEDAKAGLENARQRLLELGSQALDGAGEDAAALRDARRVAAVARGVWPDDEEVESYLQQVDLAEQLWQLNSEAEEQMAAGNYGDNYGEAGNGGAMAVLREVLALSPGQPRAMQNVAAVESALIRNAETAADEDDFDTAGVWLDRAGTIRPEASPVPDARERIERQRSMRIAQLRAQGVAVLGEFDGIAKARAMLGDLLRLAEPGDPAATELRERIDLAVHYGLFRPGQMFTDALETGGRGPRMVVVPHGAFTMGAPDNERGSTDHERPQRNISFDRGFAMAVTEVSVGEFRRFINATGFQPRAVRRGFSMAWDARSGNFVRSSRVAWSSGFAGGRTASDMPVIHVSVEDAQAYVDWLSQQTGRRYRLPSEAEFEYALRMGTGTAFPWGDGEPPEGSGNFTGSRDRSTGGRSWSNAFSNYSDGHWGPAPVGSFSANEWGLHDLAGNVSEWVADCWHDSYRRAPRDAAAWVNPGCRTYVIRGGAWASSPEQTRSAWRAPAERDTTNARIGFRVVRDL